MQVTTNLYKATENHHSPLLRMPTIVARSDQRGDSRSREGLAISRASRGSGSGRVAPPRRTPQWRCTINTVRLLYLCSPDDSEANQRCSRKLAAPCKPPTRPSGHSTQRTRMGSVHPRCTTSTHHHHRHPPIPTNLPRGARSLPALNDTACKPLQLLTNHEKPVDVNVSH